MPLFSYQARSRDGSKMSGEMDAASVDDAVAKLRQLNAFPLKIKEIEKKATNLADIEISFKKKEKITTKDLIFFSRQMFTLTKASVPILSALDGLLTSASSPELAKVIASIKRSLDEGIDLTQALRRHPDVFPTLYVSMVTIGETTGKLPQVFEELANYLQKEQDTRQKIKSALRYPMMVMAVIGIGMVIISMFVLPKFADMFAGFNAELPLPTRMLIAFSDFMQAYWYIVMFIPIGFWYGFKHYINTEEGRYNWHTKQLKLPLFGDLLLKGNITRFARSLAITGKAGVPMEQALRIIGPTVGNDFMEEKIRSMRDGVERGESITANMKRMDLFPGMVIQMISIGEDTGSLDEMVMEIAEYYERELDQSVETLTAAIEPIVIVFVACLVLILALGIFLPMISLMGAIGA